MSVQYFQSQVDSVDCFDQVAAVGLSNLEGNTWDGEVKLLSLESGEILQSLPLPTGVATVRFVTKDGSIFAAGCDDGVISMHKTACIEEFQVLEGHDDCVSSIVPSGTSDQSFLSAGWDGSIKLWDVYSTQPIQSIDDAHHRAITCLSVQSSTGSNMVASVGQDGFLRFWDPRRSFEDGCVQIHSTMEAMSCAAWGEAEHEHLLFIGTDAGHVCCYDTRMEDMLPQPQQQRTIANTMEGGDDVGRIHCGRVRTIRSVAGVLGQKGSVLVTSSDDCTVAVSSISSIKNTHISAGISDCSGIALNSVARYVVC
jgi:WD40 repeat protein